MTIPLTDVVKVSVPLWGLFNLTISSLLLSYRLNNFSVSVPLWGLFNLTFNFIPAIKESKKVVSVPLWGLFNLTLMPRLCQ